VIRIRDYDDMLRRVAGEFLVFTIFYVQDLRSWAKEKGIDLSEPSQPMKLTAVRDKLMLFVQEDIEETKLSQVITALEVRWSLKDNVSDPSKMLNSLKKRLGYCFFKEYARTLNGVAGDDLLEDEWAIREMEKLGFFNE
jgi:hypothetical protein